MRKILFLIILIPIICFSFEYTVDQLIEIGLEKSLEMKQTEINSLNIKSDLTSSYYDLIPSLNLNIGKSLSDGDWSDATGSLNLSESISSNESRYFSIKNAIINDKNSVLSFEDSRRKIAFDIFEQYLLILESQITLDIQKKNLELQKNIHKQTEVKYEIGELTLLDLQQSEITLINYEIAVTDGKNVLNNERITLFSHLEIEDEGFLFKEIKHSVNHIEKDFFSNNLLKISENRLLISELDYFKKKLNMFPVFSIGFSYGFANSAETYIDSLGVHTNPISYYDFLNYSDSYTVSLNFSYSIFDIFDKRLGLKVANRNLKLQKLEYEKSIKNNNIKFKNLERDIGTLEISKELYNKKLKLSSENLKMAQEQYTLGLINLLDLEKITLDHSNAQLSYYKQHFNLIRKREEVNLLMSDKILGKW